jgi:hypothetical protein
MTSTYRTFAKTIIQTKPGVEKEGYLKQFAIQAFSIDPHPLYNMLIEHDSQEVQPASQAFAGRLLRDSELASSIPLVPASMEPDAKFDDLQPEVKRVYENYPLIEGERISSIKMLCLESEWEGMARRTLFFERETNLSRVYFAVRRFRAEPQTPGLTPALLLGFDSGPIPRVPAAMTGSHKRKTMLAGSDDSSSIDGLAQNVFSLSLDTISTLSWATPAGPFVSAGITIFKAIFGNVFGPKEDLIGTMRKIANDVVERIEYFQENATLKDQLDTLKTFSIWIANVETRLDTQDPEVFNHALTDESGILSTLNDVVSPRGKTTLLSLTGALSEDGDLKQGGGYDSRRRWSLANAKLHLLFLATSQYLMALKFRITLLAKLNEFRYDANGRKMEPWESNSDNTFAVLIKEMRRFKDDLPKVIDIVRARRAAMVVLEDNSTTACVSMATRPKSASPDWGVGMNKHDAMYWGYDVDRFVRGYNVVTRGEELKFEHEFDPNGRIYNVPYPWRQTEIRDKAIYDGQNPQDFILLPAHWGQGGYFANTERAEALKREYLSGMLNRFDEVVKIPGNLESGLTSLLNIWKPQIPANLPVGVKLDLRKGDCQTKKNELWSDKTIEVRYLFTLMSMAGNESAKSNDLTSTRWYAPLTALEGHCPEIIGLPTKGEYLKYVQSICLYRQFKKLKKDGSEHVGDARRVAVIQRLKDKDEFPDQHVDRESTKHDSTNLSEE